MGFACDLTVPKRKLVIGASKHDDLGIGKKEEILGMSSLPNEKTISEKKFPTLIVGACARRYTCLYVHVSVKMFMNK